MIRQRCSWSPHSGLGSTTSLATWSFRVAAWLTLVLFPLVVHGQISFEEEPFNYNEATPDDPVAKLNASLAKGGAKLEFDPEHGYLPAVLKALRISTSSQMLVYSKTSFQQRRISPQTPRAVYFNDHTYIGWVQGGDVVEVSTVDPQLGAVFYTLAQQADDKARFVRQTYDCTQCHASAITDNVPGHIVRSVYSSPDGTPILRAGSFVVDHTTPIRQRWGGWYVTGKHGAQRHLGNLIVRAADNIDKIASGEFEMGDRANAVDLERRFDPSPYLSRHSDIVALMVLEHQVMMHNAITRANYQGRLALRDEQVMNAALERPADYRSESSQRRLDNIASSLIKVMLFAGEAPITEPIVGTSGFAEEFAKSGPHDAAGRSLRDLDLKTRLFKYPCSYLIYSDAFEGLPGAVKEIVYRQLADILAKPGADETYKHLTVDDRAAIRDILIATKRGLPESWKAAGAAKKPIEKPVEKSADKPERKAEGK